MGQKQVLVLMLVSIAFIIFGGIGYLLAIEGVPFFAALKSFFLVIISFGGILIAFFSASFSILWVVEKISGFFKKK